MLRLLRVPFKSISKKSRLVQLCMRHCTSSSYLGVPEVDVDYFLDEANLNDIVKNIQRRRCLVDVNKILHLSERLGELRSQASVEEDAIRDLREQLLVEIDKIPNRTHRDVLNYQDNKPHIVRTYGEQRCFDFKPRTIIELTEACDLIRMNHLGSLTGHRSYYLKGCLADLEQALIRFTVRRLLERNFVLISVPDIISPEIIESCGMATTGKRTQVFETASPWKERFCLTGTAEMSLGGLYSIHTFTKKELPLRLCATSRCYRAETSKLQDENYSIFRVREFTKVEMFGITSNETGQESEDVLSEFVGIQEALFSEIGLCYQVLDMPPNELGNSAYRKYDIEAWMPGRKLHGEISSASNCTDYQSRRLHMKYRNEDSNVKHVHTVNGTACAVPRMLIALLENFQNDNGSITVPHVLRSYMDGKSVITIENPIMKMKRSSY